MAANTRDIAARKKRALSDLQKEYREHFRETLDDFDAEGITDLEPEEKSDFFNQISDEWEIGKGKRESRFTTSAYLRKLASRLR